MGGLHDTFTCITGSFGYLYSGHFLFANEKADAVSKPFLLFFQLAPVQRNALSCFNFLIFEHTQSLCTLILQASICSDIWWCERPQKRAHAACEWLLKHVLGMGRRG